MTRATEHRRVAATPCPPGFTCSARLQSARNLLIKVVGLGRAALAEIFDEAAYARFLSRNGVPASRSAFAAFLREKSGAPRPRCC